MAKMDERVEMIGSSILAQAEHESKEIIDKANSIREHEIKNYEETLIADLFTQVQQQTSALRVDTVKTVSTAQVEARRSLLRRREELAGVVIAAVRTRLFEYAKTPEYTASLQEELASLAAAYDHSKSTVYLREADLGLEAQVKALLPGCAVARDPAIRCGGWKLVNTEAGILIDETLDTRLADQKAWFLLNSGLRIE